MTEKEQIAREIVKRHMLWSAGGALLPIPFVDMLVISGAQFRMLSEISKIYDIPFEKIRVKAIIGTLLGYVLHPALSTGLLGALLFKMVPGFGALVGTPTLVLFAGGYAWALGRVFIQHFEAGGTFLDFDPKTVKQHFRAEFGEGQKLTAAMRTEQRAEA